MYLAILETRGRVKLNNAQTVAILTNGSWLFKFEMVLWCNKNNAQRQIEIIARDFFWTVLSSLDPIHPYCWGVL